MTKFNAGKYWIGDPCYAVKDSNWIPLLEKHDYLNNGEFEYNGFKCFASGTKYGDGSYQDKTGQVFGVDAGLLSVMPFDACDGDSMNGGNVFEFDSDFEVRSENGNLHFGENCIITDGSDEPDWDDEDDEEDEEEGICEECGDYIDSCECSECGGCSNSCDCEIS